MYQPTTDTPKAPAVLNVAEKFSLTTVMLSRQNTIIHPNKASSYWPGRVATEKFSSSLGYLCKPIEISQCPQVRCCQELGLAQFGWADGSAGAVSCSPGLHGVPMSSLLQFCLACARRRLFLFPSHNKKGGNRNINLSFLVLGDSNQTLLCFSPGSFHSLCHGCRKSLIFSIFFVFLLVCSPSVHSISTALLLFCSLAPPKR